MAAGEECDSKNLLNENISTARFCTRIGLPQGFITYHTFRFVALAVHFKSILAYSSNDTVRRCRLGYLEKGIHTSYLGENRARGRFFHLRGSGPRSGHLFRAGDLITCMIGQDGLTIFKQPRECGKKRKVPKADSYFPYQGYLAPS